MSQIGIGIGRFIGVVLLAGGVAAGVLARREQDAVRADAEARTAAARAAAAEDVHRLEEATRVAEERGARAAALQPLNAAVESHVDGPTLVDLFEHEEWWQPFREDFAVARIIVGDLLIGTWSPGKLDVGSTDAPIVRAVRGEKTVASMRATLGGQTYVLVASRLSALPDRKPVLVLARRVPRAPAVAGPPPRASSPLAKPFALPAGGGLAALGLLLVIFGGKKRRGSEGAAVAAEVPREPTLRFGTPARPVPVADTSGGRPPLASAGGMSIPGSANRAAAPGATPGLPMTAAHAASLPTDGAVEAVARLDSGRTFGRYRLLDRLGEGGMSEVFTAVAQGVEGFSRTFVLKRLRPELAREREAIAQFIDEARLQAGLVHSNIVPVFDFGMVGNGEYFMTQEYIVGRDLLRILDRHHRSHAGGLDPGLAFYVAHETLQALAYAHDYCDKEGAPMHLVHRDVSPGNLMVSLRGEVKLADFGIVKASRRVSRTQVGMVKGNANFMSPEQARGAEVDARSDLFSLATVLFYCLTGELLYSGANDLDVLYKAARGPTPEDMMRIAMLPEPAASVLAKALAFEPVDRFQSASEFADQLAPFVGGGKAQAARLVQELFGEELRRQAAA